MEREEEEKKKNDKAELDKVVEAIACSKTDADCEASLQAFRNYLKTKELITSGKHFNIQLLIEAFKSYDNNFNRLVKKLPDGNDDYRKVDLFWRNVIGYIQRYLPACYAQAFCQGLYSLVEEKKNLRRSVEFLNDPGIFLFPLAASSGVGYDYATGGGVGGGRRRVEGWDAVGVLARCMLGLKSYMEQNQQRCTNLCNGMETSQRAGVR